MRLDNYLFEKNSAKSRTYAKSLIEQNMVKVNGKIVTKPSLDVGENDNIEVIGQICPYVSRGGLKLEAALKIFGVETEGRKCMDVGASTGGFTDCLLQHGAKSVLSIDCGHGQLDEKIKSDKRVTSVEGFNAKNITPAEFGCDYDVCVMDVSFISQTLLHKNVADILKPGGYFVTLIKPQFEAGRGALNGKGIVTDEADRMVAVYKVTRSALECGFIQIGSVESPIKGGDGNTEYIAVFKLGE